jgi:hypothetical protein
MKYCNNHRIGRQSSGAKEQTISELIRKHSLLLREAKGGKQIESSFL